MEKQPSLSKFDKSIRDYYHKYNYIKKDNLFCYSHDKRQIAEFYNKMSNNFYHDKLQSLQNSKRINKKTQKLRIKIQNNIKNPLKSGLPNAIQQNNLIDASKIQANKMSNIPIFSLVESTKQQKYVISEETRQIINSDIAQLTQQKEYANFRLKFPKSSQKNPNITFNNNQTEHLIKEFNKLLIKYKGDANILDEDKLKIVEKQYFLSDMIDNDNNDQKYRILTLLKEMFLKTNSETINEKLINYVLKCQMEGNFKNKLSSIKTFGRPKSLQFSKTILPKKDTCKNIQNVKSKKILPSKSSSIKIIKNNRSSLESQCIQFSATYLLQNKNKMQESEKVRSRTSFFSSKIRIKMST